jgi:hypothetical protein
MKLFLLALLIGCNSNTITPNNDVLGDNSTSGGDAAATPSGEAGKKLVQVGVQADDHNKGGFFRNMVRQGPPPGLTSEQCKDITSGGPVHGPGCVSSDIKCGQTIVGHTRGGSKNFDTKWYDDHYCWPETRNHNGGDERLYRFDPNANGIPARFWATVWFDTPCEQDIDVTVFMSRDGNVCPAQSIKNCEMPNPFTPQNRTRRSERVLIDPGEIWYVLVEGADDKEGAFSVTFDCELGQ